MLSKVTPRAINISEGNSVTFRPNDNLTLTCEVFDSKPAANISWVIKLKDRLDYEELFPCKHQHIYRIPSCKTSGYFFRPFIEETQWSTCEKELTHQYIALKYTANICRENHYKMNYFISGNTCTLVDCKNYSLYDLKNISKNTTALQFIRCTWHSN